MDLCVIIGAQMWECKEVDLIETHLHHFEHGGLAPQIHRLTPEPQIAAIFFRGVSPGCTHPPTAACLNGSGSS